MKKLKFSICTTNYNCAHALLQHLDSIYSLFDESEFEYIVVDNKSKDKSMEILNEYQGNHENMTVLSEKCTMGKGRQIAFKHSNGDHIVVIDTDTIYQSRCKTFIETCLKEYQNTAVQARYCAVIPRKVWINVGGRRDLNVNEDFDMWMRMWKIGKMKWYPISMGENVKDQEASSSADYLSNRYKKFEKIIRLIRREIDLHRTRKYKNYDFKAIYQENQIDLGLGPKEKWFGETSNRPWFVEFTRNFIKTLKS
jgi:glycosyltransferase involved in cell wall biosynthesis